MQQAEAVVLYHADCTDGFGAAWAFSKLRAALYAKVHYIPAVYGTRPPPVMAHHDVYVLDFCYPLEQMLELAKNCATLWLLDHHKTARTTALALRQQVNSMITYHEEKSGAGLTWDTLSSPSTRPLIISLIEDRDLWKWELPNSKELNAVIGATEHSFEAFDSLASLLRDSRDMAVTMGELLLKQRAKYVADICKNAVPIAFLDQEGYLCQCPHILSSDVGGALAAPAILYHTTKDGEVKISLRAPKSSTVNVREIAERFGGGGHDKAAGFTVTEADFLSPWFWETLESRNAS